MSQPMSKKSRFEVPPLNWKAPDTRPDPETQSRPENTEAAQDKNAARVPACPPGIPIAASLADAVFFCAAPG